MNRLFSAIGALLLLIQTGFYGISQTHIPDFQHFTTEDGLPGPEVFDIVQDTHGIIWFATGYGICRFDGYTFKTYTTRNGLPANSTVVAFLDYQGRPWFSSYEGYISYIDGDSCHSLPWNDTISTLSLKYSMAAIHPGKEGSVLFKPLKVNRIYKIDREGQLQEVPPPGAIPDDFTMYITEDQGQPIWNFVSIPSTDVQIPAQVRRDGGIWWLKFSTDRYRKNVRPRYQKIDASSFMLSIFDHLWHISGDRISRVKTFSNDINHFLLDPAGNLWVAVEYEGVYLFPAPGSRLKPHTLFPGKNITKIFMDRERNIWIGTIEDGVYLIPAMQFANFFLVPGTEHQKITALCLNGRELYFSTYDKRLFRYDTRPRSVGLPEQVTQSDAAINDIVVDNNGKTWLLGIDFMGWTGTRGDVHRIELPRHVSFFEGEPAGGDTLYCASSEGLFGWSAHRWFLDPDPDGSTTAIRCLSVDPDTGIWLGTLEGLYLYRQGEMTPVQISERLRRSRITGILRVPGHLICGTRSEGLILLSLRDGRQRELTTENGLGSNMINVLFAEDNLTCWVGTNKGIDRIDISDWDSVSSRIQRYTRWDGLPVSKINDIAQSDNSLWLATDQGLIVCSPEGIARYRIAPKLKIDRVTINDRDTLLRTCYDLPYNQNTIAFGFTGIALKDPGQVNYRYRLMGYDADWVESRNRTVRYTMLPPGEYTFLLAAAGVDDHWNDQPLRVDLRIRKHFTRKVWFPVALSMGSLAFLTLLFLLILKNQRKKASLRHALLLSEQKALRSQMNPHFLFNSLNSIQNLIFKKDEEKADLYLSNFSTLMRRILENSSKNTVSLQTELETVRLYIELEALRFSHSFEFQLVIDPQLNPEHIEIPPMLIQPFLENAILHGLLPKDGLKVLTLNIQPLSEKYIRCLIEDNGIGRGRAGKRASWKKRHSSMGQKNVEERLGLMNLIFNTSYELKIIDLFDANGQSAGTRVEIILPCSGT